MPVMTQKFIFRSDLRTNPTIKYLFDDNLVRRGYGGQAKEMRDGPNAIGVATKATPSNRPGEFLSDDDTTRTSERWRRTSNQRATTYAREASSSSPKMVSAPACRNYRSERRAPTPRWS